MQNYTFDEVKMSHVAMLGAKNSLVSKARRAASGQGLASKAGFAVFVAALFLYEIWFSLVVYIDLLFKNLFGKRKKALLAVAVALLLCIGAVAGVSMFRKNTSKRPVLSSTKGEGTITENAGQTTDGAEEMVVTAEEVDSEDANSDEANSEGERVLRPVLRPDGTLDYGDSGDSAADESSDVAELFEEAESDQTEESEAADPDHTKELDDYVEKITATGFSISDADESNTGETTEGEDKLPEGKLPVISTKDSGEGATASGSENTSSSSNGSASDSESSSSSSSSSSTSSSSSAESISLPDTTKNTAGTRSTSDTERTSSSSSNATSRRIPDSLIPDLPESSTSSGSGISTGSGSSSSTGSRSSSGIGIGSSSSSASKDTGKVYYEVDAPLAKDEEAPGSGSSKKGDKNVKGTVTSRKETVGVGLDSSNTVEVDVTNTGVGISAKDDSTVDGGSSTVGHGSLVTRVEVPTDEAENKPDYTQMSFDELREENPDFYGLISSDDANIDSLVMFCKERMDEYLYRDFSGNEDKNGLPSIVDEVTGDLSTIIIYARNTDGNGEFAGILKYSDKSSINDESIIRLDKDGENQEFKVITSFTEKGGSEEGMMKIGDKAKLGDCFLVLVTDMPDGDRFYIIAQSV